MAPERDETVEDVAMLSPGHFDESRRSTWEAASTGEAPPSVTADHVVLFLLASSIAPRESAVKRYLRGGKAGGHEKEPPPVEGKDTA